MILEITNSRLQLHLPGANDLIYNIVSISSLKTLAVSTYRNYKRRSERKVKQHFDTKIQEQQAVSQDTRVEDL